MAMPAMWMQETYTFSSRNATYLLIFIGLVAISLFVQAIVTVSIAMRSAKAVKELMATADEFKLKLMPLIQSAMNVSQTSEALLKDAAPKVKKITDNLVKTSDYLVETSAVVKGSAQQFDTTLTDVNARAQKQVARVDGMVTTVLNTTAEIVENVSTGIRGPVHKIGVLLHQARFAVEGAVAKVKSMAAGNPLGKR